MYPQNMAKILRERYVAEYRLCDIGGGEGKLVEKSGKILIWLPPTFQILTHHIISIMSTL